jgi:hypothetical protein
MNRFRLKIKDTWIDISEPIGWADLELTLKRDPKYFGFSFEFSDGEVDLGFDKDSGYDVILSEFRANGTQTNITLQYYAPNGTILFEGILDFSGINIDECEISLPVTTSSGSVRLSDNFDKVVDMNRVTSLSGKTVTPPTLETILTPIPNIISKVVVEKADELIGITQVGSFSPTPAFQPPLIGYYVPSVDTFSLKGDSLTLNPNYAANAGITTTLPTNRASPAPYLAITKNGAAVLFEGKWAGVIRFESIQDPSSFTWSLRFFVQYGAENPIEVASELSGSGGDAVDEDASFNINFSKPLYNTTPTDEIFTYVQATYTSTNSQVRNIIVVEETVSNFSLKAFDLAVQQLNKLDLLPTLAQCVSVASDLTVDSEYFTTGCGKDFALMHGGNIRSDKLFKTNCKDWFESMKAIFNIGFGVENGVVKIEKISYFFQDTKIIDLPSISDYKETIANDFLYSGVNIGYEKLSKDGDASADDFQGLRFYNIQDNGAELELKSKYLGSGIALQQELSIKEDRDNKGDFDDELFILPTYELNYTGSLDMNQSNSTIKFNSINPCFRFGDTFAVTTFTTYTVIDILEDGVGSVTYEVTPAPTTTSTVSGQTSTSNVRIEESQNATAVSGVFNPLYRIGYRNSPVVNLKRHSALLASGWGYNVGALDSTVVENDTELNLTLDNEFDAGTYIDGQDFTLDVPFYSPEYVEFSAPLTFEELTTIRTAYSSTYGYIRYKYNNVWYTGWLMELGWNPEREFTKFKLLKRI